MATIKGDSATGDLQQKVKPSVKVMEAALAQLAEEEGEITRQRRALVHDIQTRYAAGLRHLADARDQTLISLRDAAQAAHDKVEAETTHAKMILQSMSQVDTVDTFQQTHSSHALQAVVPNNATLRHFQQISKQKGPKTYFSHSSNDSVKPSLIDSCTQFMGTVVPFGQASDLTSGPNKPPECVDAVYMDLISNANLHGVTTLQADVEKLQKNLVTNLQRDVTSLQDDVGRFQQSLTEMKTENARLMKQIQDKVLSDNTRLDTGLRAVKEEVGNLRQELDSEKQHTGQEMDAIRGDLTTNQREISSLNKTMATLKDSFAKGTASVAFHASLGAGTHETAKNGEVIKCDQILINVGGGYNPQTGIFTAPVSGTYIFMATTNPSKSASPSFWMNLIFSGVTVPNTVRSSFWIIVNGEKVAWTRSERCGASGDSYVSCTAHVVVQITQGQQVCMKSDGDSIFRSDDSTYFSGVLLHPTL